MARFSVVCVILVYLAALHMQLAGAEPTHLHPPDKPHLESVEETAKKAEALAVRFMIRVGLRTQTAPIETRTTTLTSAITDYRPPPTQATAGSVHDSVANAEKVT